MSLSGVYADVYFRKMTSEQNGQGVIICGCAEYVLDSITSGAWAARTVRFRGIRLENEGLDWSYASSLKAWDVQHLDQTFVDSWLWKRILPMTGGLCEDRDPTIAPTGASHQAAPVAEKNSSIARAAEATWPDAEFADLDARSDCFESVHWGL